MTQTYCVACHLREAETTSKSKTEGIGVDPATGFEVAELMYQCVVPILPARNSALVMLSNSPAVPDTRRNSEIGCARTSFAIARRWGDMSIQNRTAVRDTTPS
jgi:hypothetical protein